MSAVRWRGGLGSQVRLLPLTVPSGAVEDAGTTGSGLCRIVAQHSSKRWTCDPCLPQPAAPSPCYAEWIRYS